MFTFPPEQLADYQDFAYGEAIFNDTECETILSLVPPGAMTAGTVGDARSVDHGIRRAEVARIDWNEQHDWLYQRLNTCVQQCNQSFYRYVLTGFIENLEIIRYPLGHHYDWHQDFASGPMSIRKLSLVVQLAAPEAYEGGDLEFFTCSKASRAPRTRGTVIVFPSYQVHRVLPVQSGIRHSLVGWVSGPHFR